MKHLYLTPDDLAALAEGRLRGGREARAKKHLSRCSECLEAYSELVRTQLEADMKPEEFEAGPEVKALGAAIARAPTSSPSGSRSVRWIPSRVGVGFGLAAAAALLAIGVWGLQEPGRNEDRSLLAASIPPPVREALDLASSGGLLYPGADPVSPAVEFRSGTTERSPALDAALASLRIRFQDSPDSPDLAYLLAAGYCASGSPEDARTVLASYTGETDVRLRNLLAIILVLEGSTGEATQLLEGILSESPGNREARYNLAYLRENGSALSP